MKVQTALSFAALGSLTSGCLLHDELDGEEHNMDRRQASTAKFIPVGKGDRFKDGAKAPQGIGSNPKDFTDDSKLAVFSVTEIESAIKGLQKTYPEKISFEPAGAKTHEGREIHYGVVGNKEPRAFLTSGVHARERGGPDNVLYLVSDLLWADQQNTGLTYGDKSYDVSQVRQILDAGIAIIPAVNPDGINYDQTTDLCWRKNRRPVEGGIGVDINRNFNIFRDQRLFSDQAKLAQSDIPTKENYIGPQPVSEAESRSITDVFERVTSLSRYLDLHSALGQVLYSWGTDEAQVDDPTMNFANKTFDGQRGVPGDSYKEYMEPDDFAAQKAIAERMANAMNDVAKRDRYSAAETITLSPAMGASDEAMSRYYNHTCGANRINALTFEFGWGENRHGKPRAYDFQTYCHNIFYPNATEYRDNVLHTSVGMFEFLLNAAGKDGERKVYECETNKGNTQAPAAQNRLTAAAEQKCGPAARDAHFACDQSDRSCMDKVRQKANDCALRANFAELNATALQAWMKKDFDMIRQIPNLQFAMDADATLEYQLGTRLDAAEQDLIQNFADFDFETRVQNHFKGFDDVPNLAYRHQSTPDGGFLSSEGVTSDLQRTPVTLRHPGYPDQHNILLILPAFDLHKKKDSDNDGSDNDGRIDFGLHHETARVACAIVANCRWDGFLSEDKASGARPVMIGPDDLLLGRSYYFHIPNRVGDTRPDGPYPIVPSFAHFQFPHQNLPPTWKASSLTLPASQSNTVLARDVSCRVTSSKLGTEIAHLIPRSEDAWFATNQPNVSVLVAA
ncbi:hypothetical protein MY11210_003669 [Beauveria gryllotalpidicola]